VNTLGAKENIVLFPLPSRTFKTLLEATHASFQISISSMIIRIIIVMNSLSLGQVGTGPTKAGGVNTLGAEENIVLGLTKRMASRILLIFVRHAALVSGSINPHPVQTRWTGILVLLFIFIFFFYPGSCLDF
jgi:hypothetical protein